MSERVPPADAEGSAVPASGMRELHDDPDWQRLHSRTPSAFANHLSNVLDPPVVAGFVLLAAALRGAGSIPAGLGWWLLAMAFVAGIPLLALAWFVHKGWVVDRHVVVRAQRHRLLVIAAVSALVGVLVLHLLDAPRMLVACEAAMLMGLALVALANTVVKASGHTGTMAGSAGLFAQVWTPWTLVVTVPMTLAIGWARLRAGRHSLVQVLAGGALGVLSSLLYRVIA